MDPFLTINDVSDVNDKKSMPKSEPKLSITELVSKARKQSKIEEQDNEDDERERRDSSRHSDLLHDMTAHEGHAHAVFCVAFHPEGRLLLSASGDKTVKLWDLQTHRVLTTFTEHEQWVYSVAFFHNRMAFATGCDDCRVRVYQNDTEDPINHETGWYLDCDLGRGGKHDHANGHRAGVQSVDVSRDDAYVVSASADMTIKVWRKQEKECFLTLRGHADWVTRAIFDNDGLMVVSCSYDKHAKLWRLSDGEEQLTFYGHDSWVSDVAFSPEGRSIATASGDFTVRIWQVKTVETRGDVQKEVLADGMPQMILYGHKNWVLSVNFSADGAQLCSGSADCSCIVWDIATRAVKHRIKHREWVEYAAFAPGHDRGGQLAVASCGHDIDIRLWNVEYDQVKLIAMLPAQISYLGMLYFWLRSLVYGSSWKSPPLSHMRHHALHSLYQRLDLEESEHGVPVGEVIVAMEQDPLLRSLLDQPENGADLMHTRFPRSVRAALTQWALSGDSHISWKQLLPLFMDPESEAYINPFGGEGGAIAVVKQAVRKSIGLGGQTMPSPRGAMGSSDGIRNAATRHRSALRRSLGSDRASSSSSEGEEEEEEEEAMRTPPPAGPRTSKVAFADDDGASNVVELTRTPLGLGLTIDSQYRVVAVQAGSQAARGRIAVNDRLVALNGRALRGPLEQQLRAIPVGSTVAVEVRKAQGSASPYLSSPAPPRATSVPPPRTSSSPPRDTSPSLDARLAKAKGKQPAP